MDIILNLKELLGTSAETLVQEKSSISVTTSSQQHQHTEAVPQPLPLLPTDVQNVVNSCNKQVEATSPVSSVPMHSHTLPDHTNEKPGKYI